jgi:hypothetical protein
MVSFHIKLDMNTPINWLESVIGNGQKRLSDRYRDTMRELDMMALRVIAFLLSLATLVLVIGTIPRIVSIIWSFFSNVSIVSRSIPDSVWPSIMYQLILVVWFMINT